MWHPICLNRDLNFQRNMFDRFCCSAGNNIHYGVNYLLFTGSDVTDSVIHFNIIHSTIHVQSFSLIKTAVFEILGILSLLRNCEIYRSLSPLYWQWRHWDLHACKNYCVTMHLQSFSLTEKVIFEICVFLDVMSNWSCDLDLWSRSLFNWSWCDTILALTNP